MCTGVWDDHILGGVSGVLTLGALIKSLTELYLNFGRIRRLGVEPTKLLGVVGVGSRWVMVEPSFVTVLFAAFTTVASLMDAVFA